MKLFIAGTSILIALLLTTLTALAGDFADREVHGFTVDGGLFAFEEYGTQDGSGFPYSNIYVIDTQTDEWTANSPYRMLLQDETKTVFDARQEARILAGPVMKSFENRGNIVGSNKPTEMSANPHVMAVNPRVVVPPIDDTLEFRISEKEFSPSSLCNAFGPSTGFKLLKVATKDGETTQIIHEDTNIPDSRKCPIGYSFSDLVTYYPEGSAPKFAALILIRSQGFEGPDGRFMAITGSF